jgi:hypothetical protein
VGHQDAAFGQNTPGIFANRWLTGFARWQARIITSIAVICFSSSLSWSMSSLSLRNHVFIEMRSQPSCMPNALWFRYAELCHSPQGIDELCSLPDQQVTGSMHDEGGLLLFGLDSHKTHSRTGYRLTYCFCIGSIVLTSLHVGLDVMGWHQPHLMPDGPVGVRAA